MATNYKILGQGVNQLKIDAPENGSTIISELKIKNTSYPTSVDVMCYEVLSDILMVSENEFNPNASSAVLSIALQLDGKILVGGFFSTVGGVTRNYIARLNGDGTLDTSFNPNAGNAVYSIALQSDGKVLIGGDFTTVGGVTRNRIARLNSDGTLDTTFNPNPNNSVRSIAIQSDGKILIGGFFSTVGGVTRNYIARLNGDGTLDTTFNPNANSSVDSIAIQSDGKILVGGSFSTVGGVTRNSIARLNSDGSLDTTFNPNANNSVRSIAIQSDGKILVGGNFFLIAGKNKVKLARLNSDGSIDTSFNHKIDGEAGSGVEFVAIQPNGSVLIAGFFSAVENFADKAYFARLNSDGSLDTTFNPNVDNVVYSIAIQSDGTALIGGDFTTVGGVTRNRIARFLAIPISEDKDYIIKNKPLSYDEEIKISGGIALESGQSLAIETRNYNPDAVIIQVYGIEETS